MLTKSSRANPFTEQRELAWVNVVRFGRRVESVAEHEHPARCFERMGSQLECCDAIAELGGGHMTLQLGRHAVIQRDVVDGFRAARYQRGQRIVKVLLSDAIAYVVHAVGVLMAASAVLGSNIGRQFVRGLQGLKLACHLRLRGWVISTVDAS